MFALGTLLDMRFTVLRKERQGEGIHGAGMAGRFEKGDVQMVKKFRKYVIRGDFESDVEQGVKILTYVMVAVMVFSVIVFGPVMVRIFLGG